MRGVAQGHVPIIRNVKNRIANPLMIIGNDFDPNTPLSWTRSLARALGMERSLVRYKSFMKATMSVWSCSVRMSGAEGSDTVLKNRA